MAWIETRKQGQLTNYRVVWRDRGGKRTWETFDDLEYARDFAQRVKLDGGWPNGWVRGQGFNRGDGTPMFRDYAERTISARLRADDRTKADYRRILHNHINPVIGDRALGLIDRFAVAEVADRMRAAGRKPKTIANMHSLLSSILSDAVLDGLIPRNAAVGALPVLPDAKGEEMVFLTPQEFDVIAVAIPATGVERDLTRLLVGTGLRWSEATALQVQDVDLLQRRQLHVRRAWKYRDGTFVLGEPKTNKSRRTLDLSDTLVDMLVGHVAGRNPGEFVFTTPEGRPIRHANFYHRTWRPAVFAAQNCATHRDAAAAALRAYQLEVRSAKRARRHATLTRPQTCGCPGALTKSPRIHDLRHTHISWLIDAGISLPEIQRRAGHESIQTTIDRYGHPSGAKDEINAAVDRALGVLV